MRILFVFSFSLLSIAVSAQYVAGQSVEYHYDNAGNRILREVWNPTGETSFKQSNPDPEKKPSTVNQEQVDYDLFPNPTEGKFSIVINIEDRTGNTNLQITNTMGEVVLQEAIAVSISSIDIDISAFAPGLYFVQLNNAQANFRKAIVKK